MVVGAVVEEHKPHDHGHVCCSWGSAHVTIPQNAGSWSTAIVQSTIPPLEKKERIKWIFSVLYQINTYIFKFKLHVGPEKPMAALHIHVHVLASAMKAYWQFSVHWVVVVVVVSVVVETVVSVVVVVGVVTAIVVAVFKPPHWPAHVAGHMANVNWLRQSVAVNEYEAHTAWSVQNGVAEEWWRRGGNLVRVIFEGRISVNFF